MIADLPLRLVPRLIGSLAFYWRSQHWNRARLERHADEQLRRFVRHAGSNVPYYRELFREIGLAPESFRGRSDLARIPLLDKETLRQRSMEFLADNIGRLDPAWERTSGSTGTPLRVLRSAGSRVENAAATLRSYAWAGFFPGVKVFTLRWYRQGWLFRYTMGGRSLNAESTALDRATAEMLWERINRLRPGVFHGQPFSLLMLANYARSSGIAYHCPRSIITFGESLPASQRRRLAEAYRGARVFDYYGMTEGAALITACPEGRLHVLDDYAWHEFVDERGNPVEEGRGEIVGTGFSNDAMPLIRYRTRDFATLAPAGARCPCGRSLRIVEEIEGRADDFIVTPDGRALKDIEAPMDFGVGIAASQYVQDAPDHLYVNVLPGPDYVPSSLIEVEERLRKHLGPAMRLEFRIVDQLERRAGGSAKTPFMISRIGNTVDRQGDA
jgi:phenylacetate-CoA ligase